MTIAVVGFTFISVIVLHNYMKFEKPVIAVSTSFITTDFEATTADSLKYCEAETLKVGRRPPHHFNCVGQSDVHNTTTSI